MPLLLPACLPACLPAPGNMMRILWTLHYGKNDGKHVLRGCGVVQCGAAPSSELQSVREYCSLLTSLQWTQALDQSGHTPRNSMALARISKEGINQCGWHHRASCELVSFWLLSISVVESTNSCVIGFNVSNIPYGSGTLNIQTIIANGATGCMQGSHSG